MYRVTFANCQQVPVILLNHIQVDQHSQYIRAISPVAHINMKIDQIYASIDPVDNLQPDLQLKNISVDNLCKSSDISTSVNNKVRKSTANSGSRHESSVERAISGWCGSSFRVQTPISVLQ